MTSSFSDFGSMTVSVSTLLNVALTGALAAGVYFLASNKSSTSSSAAGSIGSGGGSKKKSKGKKKGDDSPATTPVQTAEVAKPSLAKNESKNVASAAANGTSGKKKKGKKADATSTTTTSYAAAAAAASESAEMGGSSSSMDTSNPPRTTATNTDDTQGETFASKVASSSPSSSSSNKKNKKPSPAPATTNGSSSSPTTTAAEAHLASKLSPTEADPALKDMRDEEHDPTVKVARVMKVVGGSIGARPAPAGGFWDEDEMPRDDGWEVAGSKKTTKSTPNSSSSSAAAFSTSNPAPRTIPGLTASAQLAMTKKQRENQARAAKLAAAKDEAEMDRLDRLAAHRKQLERTRMMEHDAQRNKGKKAGPRSVNYPTGGPAQGSSKTQSGGMYASLDSDGKLIWE